MVIQAMELREGMTVAEIGAGTGFFSRRLAKAVGPRQGLRRGHPARDDRAAEEYTAKEKIANIVPVLGTETDPKLPAEGIDRILLVDVYHEFQKPEPMLAAHPRQPRPRRPVTLVEYRLEGETAAHINIKHRMSVEQVLAEWSRRRLPLLNQIETLPSQHLFIFTGNAAPGAHSVLPQDPRRFVLKSCGPGCVRPAFPNPTVEPGLFPTVPGDHERSARTEMATAPL